MERAFGKPSSHSFGELLRRPHSSLKFHTREGGWTPVRATGPVNHRDGCFLICFLIQEIENSPNKCALWKGQGAL